MDYFALKHMHMGLAGLSGSLFLLRGLLMLAESRLRKQRWAMVLPHVIDTLLLISAGALAMWSMQYPLQQGWLTAKVMALLVYIGLGMVALKRGRTRRGRTLAFLAALVTFSYMVAVALTKNPLVIF
jgi:uncharacterized membrane protein SirB2